MNKLILILSFCFALNNSLLAEQPFSSEKHDFVAEVIVSNLENPWALEFLVNGNILVTERSGRLLIIHDEKFLKETVNGLPNIKAFGQGGLLDIALDPDFKNNQMIYLSYVGPGKNGVGTEVAKARLVDNELMELVTLFKLSPKSGGGNHFGSRLLFANDGTLFISLGDRGDRPRAQDLSDHAGSLIRINSDGSIPHDNPFVSAKDVKPEIYTYGNRNMQGMAKHPVTGDIWTVEHGPRGGDELNLMSPGSNYGWPVITYGKNYVIRTSIGEGTEKKGMAKPVHYWVPSIATSALLFYDGDAFPQWKGNAFVGSLKFGELVRLELNGNKVIKEERLLNGTLGRIREVKQGPDGFIYLLTDEANGKLIQLKPDK